MQRSSFFLKVSWQRGPGGFHGGPAVAMLSAAMDEVATSLERIRACLARSDREELERCLVELHPSDIAGALEELDPAERDELFRLTPPERAGQALAELGADRHPERIVAALPEDYAAAALASMADDDAADLLGPLPVPSRRRLLAALPEARAAAVRTLLGHDESSAGGIMTTGLVALAEDLGAGEAIAEVRRQGSALEDDFSTLFVVDGRRRLVGSLALRTLVLASAEARLSELAERPPATVRPEVHQQEVGRLLRHYGMPSIAVVDEAGTLLGRVTWDDALDVLEEEQTEDILRLSGTAPEEEVRGGWPSAVRGRLPWLFLNLATAALASVVIYLFRGAIDRLVVLAAVMPVVAALGGNAGIQALAVTIRRITLEGPARPGRWGVAAKELFVGLVNGAALGLTVGLVALLWQGELRFGLVVLAAMWGNLVIASFAGAFVPILLERVGVDPAVASSVFVTTFTDLVGFVLLLGLASLVLL